VQLNAVVKKAWQDAEDAGWHKRPTTDFERIALIHSEVSEALECLRRTTETHWYSGDAKKPEGVGPELADVVIRVAELAHILGVDLDFCVAEKMDYNRRRHDVPKHGTEKRI
jgi:NTP pyrophosphatase (non-canonical NTP hydrolase)